MGWIDGAANAKASADRDGDFFVGPNDRGVAVLLDAQIFKGNSDEHTYKLLFEIESSEGPNAAGTKRVVLKKLDTKPYEKGFAKAQVCKMTKTDPNDSAAYSAVLTNLFRLDDEGHTKPGTACPIAGTKYNFSVRQATKKDGSPISVSDFSPAQ